MKKSDALFLMGAVYLAKVVTPELAIALGMGCVFIAFLFKHGGD